jgi:hypothetical protein
MRRLSALVGLFVLLATSAAWGQTTILEPIVYDVPDSVTVWRPATTTTYLPPTTVTPAGTTTVTYSTPYTTSYSPVVTRYAPIEYSSSTYYSAPVRTYYSPTTTYYSAPVTTYYSPVVTAYPPSYVLGSGSIGQPVAYVPGQPVRNVLRFFSP